MLKLALLTLAWSASGQDLEPLPPASPATLSTAAVEQAASEPVSESELPVLEDLQTAERTADTPRAFRRLALGYSRLGDHASAAKHAREALRRDPDDKAAFAVWMLSRRSAPVPPPERPVELFVPPSGSPESLAAMRQAVAARRAGDAEGMWAAAQAALREDPRSPDVQRFHMLAETEHRKQARTALYLTRVREAASAGRGEEAVAWAQMAAELSGDPTARRVYELAREKFAQKPEAAPPLKQAGIPINPALPLGPIGGGLGLAALAYAVTRSRRSWSASEDEPPADEDPGSARVAESRRRLKVAAAAAVIGFGVAYGGPALWRIAAAPAASALRAGIARFQTTVLQSEAGTVKLPGEPFLKRGTDRLLLSNHALVRMQRRQISHEEAQAALSQARGFAYFHEGVWKNGYHDPARRIFIGEYNGTITTIINNVKPQYIENIKRNKP